MSGPHQQLAILAAASYFIGALPFGLILGKLKGTDIREHGSKNIGASNAGRVLGRRYFFIVFALEFLKSFVPMILASVLVHSQVAPPARTQLTYLLWIAVGVAAILGHVFPIYLKFRGGKGVATSAGVIVGLWPYFTFAGFTSVIIFVCTLKLSKYISLSSIAAAIGFPIAYVTFALLRGWRLFDQQLPLLLVSLGIASLVIWRHRENIRRLQAGTENKIRQTRQPA
jgi:acyl phosphate:glycerol-3-phosphate acyltransferase